jgi:Tol biopolymer transport system component
MTTFYTHVFRMDADGRNLKQLTKGMFELSPRISLDGKWVYYIQVPDKATEPGRVCKVPIDGGEPICLATIKDGRFLDISPRDGSIAYADVVPSQDNKTTRIATVISPDGNPSKKILELPVTTAPGGPLRWSPDGLNIVFNDVVKNGLPTALGAIPVDRKGPAKLLFSFPAGIERIFEWSKDGKQLAYLMATTTSDVVLITNKGN